MRSVSYLGTKPTELTILLTKCNDGEELIVAIMLNNMIAFDLCNPNLPWIVTMTASQNI